MVHAGDAGSAALAHVPAPAHVEPSVTDPPYPREGAQSVTGMRAPSPSADDEFFDQVPAAVVCARCGEADCLGCDPDEERSGFLTIVPWEREGSSLKRLWLTARLATHQPESFFEALPDGSIAQALRFAMAAELVATAALFGVAVVLGVILLPALASHVVATEGSLAFVLRASVVGLPTVATLLVGAHVLHALSIERAARKAGAKPQQSRALRFGLYAAGWDIVLGPIGLLVLAFEGGPRLALSVLRAGNTVPGRASRAFLRGGYGITGDAAQTALRGTFIGAAVATTLAALALFALGTAFVLTLASHL
jgi:hypothetical protein